MRCSLRAVSLLFLLAAIGHAQRTFLVDHAGGAGVDFSDLPPALAVAQTGDTIRVRPHPLPYGSGTVSHGITLMDDQSSRTGLLPTLAAGMVVRGLPAGEAFVMQGFECANTTAAALTIDNCQGHVHLDGLRTLAGYANAALVVRQSVAVTVQACGPLLGAPPIDIAGSHVVLTRCTASGRPLSGSAPPTPAVVVDASSVTIADGGYAGGGASFVPPTPSSPGIMLRNQAVLELGGDQNTQVVAGGSPCPPGAIEVGAATTLVLDPAVLVAPPPSGTGTITTRGVRALRTDDASPGFALRPVVRATGGPIIVLCVALPLQPLLAPPFGELWIDPLALLEVFVETQNPSNSWTAPMPPLPTWLPRGTVLALQALSGTTTDLQLGNPVVVVVH